MESARKAKYYVETTVELTMEIGEIVMETASTNHRHVMEFVQREAACVGTNVDLTMEIMAKSFVF